MTSKIDSRTILGEQGAEQLLGQGDMLHMAGGGRIVRVHGPFVSDEEVESVVAHLRTQGRPDYLETVTEVEEEVEEPEDKGAVFDKGDMAAEDGNDLYDKAVKVVLRDKKCSTSYIQRRLASATTGPHRWLNAWRRKVSSAPPTMSASARSSMAARIERPPPLTPTWIEQKRGG